MEFKWDYFGEPVPMETSNCFEREASLLFGIMCLSLSVRSGFEIAPAQSECIFHWTVVQMISIAFLFLLHNREMRPKYYKNSLPIHLQKQLVDDIEAAGGIEKCVGRDKFLSNLLNKLGRDNPLKLELYGNLTDPVRQKIQKKVWSWQKIFTSGGQVEYDKFLEQNFPGVTPFRFRRQQQGQQQQQQQPVQPAQPTPKKEPAQQSREQHDPAADLLLQFSKLNLKTMTTPPPQQREDPPPDDDGRLITHFVTLDTTPIPFKYDKRKTHVIFANTEWLEHNIPFQVHDITNIQDVNLENTYYGFSCLEEIDERAVSTESSTSNFRGKIVAPNILKFSAKAMHPCFEQGSNDLDFLEVKPTAQNLLRAINNTHARRKRMDEKERMEREWKDVLIVFPTFVKLTAKNLWKIGADETELRPHSVKIPYMIQKPGKPTVYTWKRWFHWDVARIDYLPTRDSRVEEEVKNYDAQALDSPPAVPPGASSAFPFGSPGASAGGAYGHQPGAGHYPGAGYPQYGGGNAYAPAGFGSPPAGAFGSPPGFGSPHYGAPYGHGYYPGYSGYPSGPPAPPTGPPAPPTGGSHAYASTTAGGTSWGGHSHTPRTTNTGGATAATAMGPATTVGGTTAPQAHTGGPPAHPAVVPEEGSSVMSFDSSLGGGGASL